jgi:hypothetical protein
LRLKNTRFKNVDNDAIAYFSDPDPGWISIDHCGNEACTGPHNILLSFTRTTFEGQVTPFDSMPDFQIIGANRSNADGFNNCKRYDIWNAYYCLNSDLSHLAFESIDDDRMTRNVGPVQIISMNGTSINQVVQHEDHIWLG